MTRRDWIRWSAIAPAFERLAALHAAEGEQMIPFADTKAFNPERPTLPWEQTTSWLTPTEHLFRVGHYGFPDVDPAAWRLEVKGLVERPRAFTLDDIKSRKVEERTFTIECSGNSPTGGLVGNAKWRGTRLAPLLKECGVKAEAVDAVFFAADQGTEKIRGADYPQQFARSLPVRDAMKDNVLLCWSLNGQALDKNHGAPMRLVVPGQYGIAWVKWLTRIELHDRAYLGRFNGRDYVTIRGEQQDGKTIWRETSVGRMNLKSVVGRVTRAAGGLVRIAGAAWSDGTPIRTVEVKIDGGPWQAARIEKAHTAPFCWTFWTLEWKGAGAGEHTVTSRATDERGRVQPAADDPFIALKKTYWEANQQAVRKITL